MASPVDSLRQALPVQFHRDTPNKDALEKKLPKQVVLYLHRTGTQYQCQDCVFFLQQNGRCWLHSRSAEITPTATCELFVKGKPHAALQPLEPLGAVSKLESGYTDESPVGFSCKRCEYFSPDTLDCQKVDRNSPGDDTGQIHPDACCNAWEAK